MYHYEDYKQYIKDTLGTDYPVIRASEHGTLSFTPYISNGCSAACRFCSEKLYEGGITGAGLTVCSEYRALLSAVLRSQYGRKIFLSVSGMEPSESIGQLSLVRDAVQEAEAYGCEFTERVMYSNLSGFTKSWEQLTELVRTLRLTRIECSRHHFDESVNQQIVRFHQDEPIRMNDAFIRIVKDLLPIVPMTMVCVMQKTGIGLLADVQSYLDFAYQCGVRTVVFRGLSVFSGSPDGAAIASYIKENRVETLDIIRALPEAYFRLLSVTEGYYYYSFRYQYRDMQVMFEMSDYDRMRLEHESHRQHKLIFYPNGELYKDWNRNPDGKINPDSYTVLAVFAELAKELTATVDAAVFGSFGAWLTVPQVLTHTPRDLDLFVRNDIQIIRRAICILQNHGFSMYSWQDPIDENVSWEMLKGRYYVRGVRDGIHVDLSYELDGTDYESLRPHMIQINGIRTYTKEGLMQLISVGDRVDLRERLERMHTITQ